MQNRYTIVVTDGKLQGASVHADDAKAAKIEDISLVAPEINGAALSKIEELEATIKADKEAADALLEATKADAAAKLAEATAAHSQAMAEAQRTIAEAAPALQAAQVEIEALKVRVIELTPIPQTEPTLIQRLNALFDTIPAELQPMFIDPYSRIGFLVVQGRIDLAAIALEKVEVPEGYEAIREGFQQLLTI